MSANRREADLGHLRRAARLAWRGHGGAEPNPMVGCVIVTPEGRVAGEGHHRRCGGPHAEVHALRAAGAAARGATAYVTLEPCTHHGRTPPCTEALIAAGVRRVVVGCLDPHPAARGGLDRLRAAGVAAEHVEGCAEAEAVSAPFLSRMATGLPWVIAKWAQTVDGRIATRTGQSRWISGARSRRLVHRQRGRVDAILTGIGTVLADDPLLTARGVRRRRVARRIVIDPQLRIPDDARLVRTAGEIPTTVVCLEGAAHRGPGRVADLERAGVELVCAAAPGPEVPLESVLRELARRHELATVLVEAGAGLLGGLFQAGLVREAWVFVAPLLLGDEAAVPALRGLVAETISRGLRLHPTGVRRRGADVFIRYLVPGPGA